MEQPYKLAIYSHQGSKLPIALYLKHGVNTIGSGRQASCQIKLKDVSDSQSISWRLKQTITAPLAGPTRFGNAR